MTTPSDPTSSKPAASAIGPALSARFGDDSPPGAWKVAAASEGVAGADAFLCHLSRSIAAALEHLAASAEAARVRVKAARSAAAVEAQAHCDELESRIDSVEASKRRALEFELIAVDAALERLRAERGAASEAVASLSDTELEARHAELGGRLDAADAQLLALPTSVVEPPYVGVVIDDDALLAGAAVFGRVVAPLAITAADLTLEGAPSHAYPGCALLFRLVVQGAPLASQSDDELEVSLGAAAAATHVDASLVTGSALPQPMQAEVNADVPGRYVTISIGVPLDAPVGSSVCFGPLTVSGHPMTGLLGPLVVRVRSVGHATTCCTIPVQDHPTPFSFSVLQPPGPADLSPEHAAQLQAWLPPGGSPSPGAWQEVYRATTHGFGAAAFHERCDGRARLLVLVRAREGGWLFGGFTAVGFSPPERYIADPSAFLFSLTNSLGRPEKLESKGRGEDLFYFPTWSAYFGDLCICDNADTEAGSFTWTGDHYAASASTGAHPMAQGYQDGWLAAEVVAWAV